MDFRNESEQYYYGVRVTAIIIRDDKLLTYRVGSQYHLVGGAIKVDELSQHAIKREVKEELGLDCTVLDLLFVVENTFDYEKQRHHMIEFHYRVDIIGNVPSFVLDGKPFECVWIPLDQLTRYDVRPQFLKEKLKQWSGDIEHVTIR